MNSDRILLRNMLGIWSELSLLRFGVSDQNLLRKFGPISAIEIQRTNWKGEISSESMFDQLIKKGGVFFLEVTIRKTAI